jgi:hypothetical protein
MKKVVLPAAFLFLSVNAFAQTTSSVNLLAANRFEDAFCENLTKIINESKTGFQSVKGKLIEGGHSSEKTYATTLQHPDFDEAELLTEIKYEQVNGTNREYTLYTYSCSSAFEFTGKEAKDAFLTVVSVLDSCNKYSRRAQTDLKDVGMTGFEISYELAQKASINISLSMFELKKKLWVVSLTVVDRSAKM